MHEINGTGFDPNIELEIAEEFLMGGGEFGYE